MSVNPATTRTEREAWLARSRAAWNQRAAGWDAMLDERPDDVRREAQRTIEALGLEPGMRVLDAGCGTGQWAVGFAAAGCEVVALDLAPAMLERARANADEAGVRLELREGDIGALRDPEGSYDAVHCRCALQFSPDPAGALRGFRRVLRPGGRLFVSVPGALSPIYDSSWRRFIDPATFNTRILPWELETLLDHLGWELHDGWAVYMRAGNGLENEIGEETAHDLPQRLQQAAATFWCTVATAPPPP